MYLCFGEKKEERTVHPKSISKNRKVQSQDVFKLWQLVETTVPSHSVYKDRSSCTNLRQT